MNRLCHAAHQLCYLYDITAGQQGARFGLPHGGRIPLRSDSFVAAVASPDGGSGLGTCQSSSSPEAGRAGWHQPIG